MWHSTDRTGNPNHGNTRENKEKQKTFPPWEGSNTELSSLVLSRIKDRALANTKEESAGFHLGPSPDRTEVTDHALKSERWVHNSQGLKAKGGCNLSPRDCISCQAVSRLPTPTCDPVWSISGRHVITAPETSSLRRHMIHLDCVLAVDPGGACCLGLWQPVCGPPTGTAPHTHQCYSFAVFLLFMAQLSKGDWISGHFPPSGRDWDSEERLSDRVGRPTK